MVDKSRHIAKTLTWRIIASLDTFIIAWLITGKMDWASAIAGVEVLTKMILYYGHERVWYKYIKIGIKKKKKI
jgi:uncharacterized membrane protein